MKKCQSLDHPHCTHWVAEGEAVCTAGHQQGTNRDRLALLTEAAGKLTQQCESLAPVKLYLHFSGYDPRSAGGRQTMRLEVRGTFPHSITDIEIKMRCDLLEAGVKSQHLRRTTAGLWQPLLVSFSSKNKEHGQYPIEVALIHGREGRAMRKWVCSSVILIPRADASLTEIHSVFLATQKNVRVLAEDGAIATLSGLDQPNGYTPGNMHIEINAKDASIAKLEMHPPTGKYEIALGTIAWDEELIEVAIEPESLDIANKTRTEPQPQPIAPRQAVAATNCASLIADTNQPSSTIRLFALNEWVLGRMEKHHPSADILLRHQSGNEAENTKLSRRISARHAIIRRAAKGVEIIDTSRYGTLLNGVIIAKDQASPLRAGMQIEFCVSVRGIAKLQVIAIQAHVIILSDIDDANATRDLYYLLSTETRPNSVGSNTSVALPEIFHFQGGFWCRNMVTRQDTRLDASTDMRALPELLSGCHYCSSPYANINGYGAWRNDDIKI